MRKKAMDAMLKLGISANTKGFTYIADAMEIIDEDNEIRYRICKIYQAIAEKNQVEKASRVERTIRHAFRQACTNACLEDLEHYLTVTGKQSNGNLLMIFYMRLKREEVHEK